MISTTRMFIVLLLLSKWFGQSVIDAKEVDFGMVKWVKSQKGGFFHKNLQIKKLKDNSLGIFATGLIEKDEVLIQVPWDIILTSDDDDDDSEDDEDYYQLDCATIQTLALELEKGKSSKYSPYIRHLLSLSEGQLPSNWSNEGQAMLLDILGGEDQQLAPGAVVSLMDSIWDGQCQADGNFYAKAAELVLQRDDRGLMVPLYDLVAHRNGDYFNTYTDLVHGEYHATLARRDIQKGEQIYQSLDLCDECNEEAIELGYGTPELFRDYGILEQYPQRFSFQPSAIQIDNGDGTNQIYSVEHIQFYVLEDEQGNPTIQWFENLQWDDPGRNYVRKLFRDHLSRLHRFVNIVYDRNNNIQDIPEQEWDAIWNFFDMYVDTLELGIKSLINDGSNAKEPCQEGQSTMAGVCPNKHTELYRSHYHDLGWEVDELDYIEPTCEKTQITEYWQYEKIEMRQSNYQRLSFWERERDDDICMNIEDTLQICNSYRPHYHEYFVHYPARYMENIERVIFIGGGDAMLLHEVLKYPNLKKVVGLELDQQVTRKSFKYFKSQPHFDDPRVEWWYGDATKSLPLLPQEYWGSFDLVLVDLSETVMSLSVTGELDIFSALALLLKPEGVMIKNEPYIEQFSNFFDHTIHIYYGTPKICTQVLVMGSNKVDFLRNPVADQNIDRFLLEPLDDTADRFKYMHDYRKNNATEQGKCNLEGITTQHGKKAGILQVIEAENVTIDLRSYSTVENTLYATVREQGLTPISSPSNSIKDAIVIVMKEGYVSARLFPEDKYCSLDIHLWGAFQKSEQLLSAIRKKLGNTEESSFRIVAGGMFGANTLQDDEKEIGIQVSQTRNCEMEELPSSDGSSNDDEALMHALDKSLELVAEPKFTAVILCGNEGDDCPSMDLLSQDERVGSVLPLWACASLKETLEEGDFSNMYECEKEINGLLIESMKADEIEMLVIDPSATYEMAQIMNSILSYPNNREYLLANDYVFISLLKDTGKEMWRREFLELYRREKHVYTVSRVEVELKSENSNMGLEVFYCGDEFVFQHLLDLETELVKTLPTYSVQVKRISGGIPYSDPEYNDKEFPKQAYDRRPAIYQALKQKAMGRQSIFQLEYNPSGQDDAGMPTLDRLTLFLEATLDKQKYAPFTLRKYTDVGDGAVVVAFFEEGAAILLWDGQNHIDINLFSSDQDEERANQFVEGYTYLSGLSVYLRDDQPRGIGRVMQFDYEINEEEILLEKESAELAQTQNTSTSVDQEESCVADL